MNSTDAPLVYQLLKDYHEVAQHLKALRSLRAGVALETIPEQHRAAATGWFNAVGMLYLRGLIDPQVFRLVASPRAAQLWVEFVAPLDADVRRAAGNDDDEVPMIERFWREYAEGRLPTLQFVLAPTLVPRVAP